jgi:hypothetical protein
VLSNSDVPILSVMQDFAKHGIEAAYLVPTEVGIEKNILDAHASLRDFLLRKGIHDFSAQAQGPDAKIVLDVFLVESERLHKTKVSLYRPFSKEGDPRLWIYGLGAYARPWNLLAFVVAFGDLYVVNASRPDIYESRNQTGSPLANLLRDAAPTLDWIERELIEKLKAIGRLGYVDSLRHGPTGVGMTLETLLGIKANPLREPDYHGIEIKASRVGAAKGKARQRVNLFSQVPDWKKSKYKSGVELLHAFGYDDASTGRRQFYCQLDTRPNSLGHRLQVDSNSDLLRSLWGTEDVVCWGLANLKKQLELKHDRTLWVDALARKDPTGAFEQFHYIAATKTHSPLTSNFETLIEIDAITFDFTLSLVPGKRGPRARDHGYLFKIHPSNLDLLFPKSEPIKLA